MRALKENESGEEKKEVEIIEKFGKDSEKRLEEYEYCDKNLEKDKKIKIIVDSRETNSLVVEFLSEKCDIEKRVLDIGDYLISSETCCERKTTSDFVKSIIDGRLFTQLIEIKNSYSNAILIIEGNSLYENEKVKPEAIRGALASIATEIKIPILWSRSAKETAELLIAIAKREQIAKKRGIKIRFEKKPEDIRRLQEYLVAGLPNVDRERARQLLKHFKCPEFVFTATERELMKVEGIGKKLAQKIRKVLSEDYEERENEKQKKLREFNP
ncbi:MAG: ERCC4 domain-containing protein [Candidatus Aenigmatarchaeota archaeon]